VVVVTPSRIIGEEMSERVEVLGRESRLNLFGDLVKRHSVRS
jgi:hypothetical protein